MGITLEQFEDALQKVKIYIDNSKNLDDNPNVSSPSGTVVQKNTLNVKTNDTITFSTDGNFLKTIVQCYKLVPGNKGVTQIIKNFNNGEEENFYCTNNIQFSGIAKIKNTYNYQNEILNDYGLYESEVINLKEYLVIQGIEVE